MDAIEAANNSPLPKKLGKRILTPLVSLAKDRYHQDPNEENNIRNIHPPLNMDTGLFFLVEVQPAKRQIQ